MNRILVVENGQYRATKWLSDDRAHAALPPDDEAWSSATWSPRVKAAEWKHRAIVKPAKIIGQVFRCIQAHAATAEGDRESRLLRMRCPRLGASRG
jgi:hypothetical protein